MKKKKNEIDVFIKIHADIAKIKNKLQEKIYLDGPLKAAEKTDLHYTDISNWMNEKRKWSYEKILKIASILLKDEKKE